MGTIIAIITAFVTLTYSPDYSADYTTTDEPSVETYSVTSGDLEGM